MPSRDLKIFPILHWIRLTTRRDLASDATAAAIVTVLLVPQGLAYAMVAGLPPVVGLYAAIIPALLYALLGTSRDLSVGPTSIAAIMVAAAIASAGVDADPVACALILATLTGIILLAMGLLRMGVFANLLSQPVLTGFSSGAAIVIWPTSCATSRASTCRPGCSRTRYSPTSAGVRPSSTSRRWYLAPWRWPSCSPGPAPRAPAGGCRR